MNCQGELMPDLLEEKDETNLCIDGFQVVLMFGESRTWRVFYEGTCYVCNKCVRNNDEVRKLDYVRRS